MYDWEKNGIKAEIEEYQNAIKVSVEKTGKGKAAYDKDEFGLIGFQVKPRHTVSFWYDMDEEYIEISGSIEDDKWTVSKRNNCSMLPNERK